MPVQISRNLFANAAKYLSALLVGLVLSLGSAVTANAAPVRDGTSPTSAAPLETLLRGVNADSLTAIGGLRATRIGLSADAIAVDDRTQEFSASPGSTAVAQVARIAEQRTVDIKISAESFAREQAYEINSPDAAFIKVHFDYFNLPAGLALELANPDGTEIYRYSNDQRDGFTVDAALGHDGVRSFSAMSISGPTVRIRLVGTATESWTDAHGVKIGRYLEGLPKAKRSDLLDGRVAMTAIAGTVEAIHGTDDKRAVACYETSDTAAYAGSRPVGQLLMGNGYVCTAWRVGASNHLFTNNHCFTTTSEVAASEVWFNYQNTTCTGTTTASLTKVAGSTMYATDATLDYTLFSVLNFSTISAFGYLGLDVRLPTQGEQIFIPQHPGGRKKELGVVSDLNGGGNCAIDFATTTGNAANTDAGYYCDTEGGSSGSPVIARSSNNVIALHHLGWTNWNTGAHISKIWPQVSTYFGGVIPVGSGVGTVPPAATTLVSPSGTISTTTPTYKWNAVSNATWYQFWVNGVSTWYSPSEVGCGAGTGTCSFTGSALAANNSYTWYVQTYNSYGYGPWSIGMSFTIRDGVPVAATLVSPSGTITTTTPTYKWNAVSNATWYQLWVNGAGTWYTASQAHCGAGTGTCSIAGSALAANSSYTWWVQTYNSSVIGEGPWSAGMNFTISIVGPPGPATLLSPTGTITTLTPTYQWNAVSNATWYQLWVNGAGTWYTASQAHCGAGTGTCSIAGSALAANSSYTWWVQTYNSSVIGEGPWSAGMSFTISGGGFDQQFKTTPTNWSQSSGSWSWTGGDYWYTQGVDGFSSTTLYNAANFANFDYSAKLWRDGSGTGNANRLWVRSGSTMDSTGVPLDDYQFQYTSGGSYSVWKRVNGSYTALQAWTATSAINTGAAFNILRVYASGSSLYFSINGIWIWSGSDSSFTSGKVGAGMYRGASTTSNGLWIDYATLSTLEDALPNVGQVSEEQRLLNQHPSVGGSVDSATN